jgi:hypothetical protein
LIGLGATYALTPDDKRPGLSVGTALVAFLIAGAIGIVLIFLWYLVSAPPKMSRTGYKTYRELHGVYAAAHKTATDTHVVSELFLDGQILALDPIESDEELDAWLVRVEEWSESVQRALTRGEGATFMNITGWKHKKMPLAFNALHNTHLAFLDRRNANLLKIVERRSAP